MLADFNDFFSAFQKRVSNTPERWLWFDFLISAVEKSSFTFDVVGYYFCKTAIEFTQFGSLMNNDKMCWSRTIPTNFAKNIAVFGK